MDNPKNENSHKMATLSKNCMIILGYWEKPVSSNKTLQKIYSMYGKCVLPSFLVCVVLLFIEFIRLTLNQYDSIIIYGSGAVVISCIKISTKMIIFKRNNILDLYNSIETFEQEIRSSSKEIQKIYAGYVKICDRLIWIMIATNFGTIAALQILGIFGNNELLKMIRESNITSLETHYSYQFYFPGNKLDHLIWTYGINLLISFAGGMYNLTSYTIVTTLYVYAASKFHVLGSRIGSESFASKENEEVLSILRKFVKDHQDIISLLDGLNKRTRFVLLMEFLLSSVNLASVTVSLVNPPPDVNNTAFNLGYFAACFVEIYVLSSTGGEIEFQSQYFAQSVYESDWESMDKTGRQEICIMMARAQKPLVVSIGPFGAMTRETCLKMLRAAYSYVSIMKKD